MRKKIVAFGGGTGLSYLLKGMKNLPLDITAVITVADNGSSTGRLRKEFNIPAVGDIRQVITSLSNIDPSIKKMLEYRFKTSSDLDGHALGNLIITAMLNMDGSLKDSIATLSKLLNVEHRILPISEDSNITLMAEDEKGNIIEGESQITEAKGKIKKIYYKEAPQVLPDVVQAIEEADLILLSMGSLYTSILPNILCKEVQNAIKKSSAKIIYTCNALTQPGETDNFTVGDHVKLINSYLKGKKLDAVIASNSKIDTKIAKKYSTKENKTLVKIDYENIKKQRIELIESDLIVIENNVIRHNSLKLSSIIFSYLYR